MSATPPTPARLAPLAPNEKAAAHTPPSLASTETIIADMAAGRMVILVDEEDRENEGDLVLAADCVSAEAINFMARYGRGLICLTLTAAHCERLQLPPMVRRNGTVHGTAFTVSIEAASGVSTGISAADRAHTVATAVAPGAQAHHLVQPGHIFPLQAAAGGVLMRAGHTEAGCDLAQLAGRTPASVICEIMNDDGTMARLPDLHIFARTHGLNIGSIADLIAFRSRTESLITPLESRPIATPYGPFTLHAFTDRPSNNVHLALTKGTWSDSDEVLVRVHEPFTAIDLLDTQASGHAWAVAAGLAHLQAAPQGVAVLLNCATTTAQWINALAHGVAPDAAHQSAKPTKAAKPDLRTYGIGAQILRHLGVRRMRLLGAPRKMPSMTGYGLDIVGFLSPPTTH